MYVTSPIKILLAGLPTLLEVIVVEVFEKEGDFEVRRAREPADVLANKQGDFKPDVVVVRANSGSTGAKILDLLESHPRVKVLTIQSDGREAELYELTPERHSLGALSPAGLVAAIRRAADKRRIPADWYSSP